MHASPNSAAHRSPGKLFGRRLTDLVHPDYADLVGEYLRRHAAGQPAPDRLEVELQPDAAGRKPRLELSFARTTLDGRASVMVTGVEMSPQLPAASAAPRSHGSAWEALDSLADSVLTTDVEGRIVYVNRAGETLIGKPANEILGKTLADVIELVDESDRKALGDPVRQCLATGARVNLGRRGMLLSTEGDSERSIEVTVSPMRDADGRVDGTVIALRDVSDLRGLTRAMSYQASHDGLTGLVNRREFERRLEEALESTHGGGAARAVLPRPRPLQGGQRRVRPRRGRQHAARGRSADQGRGPRLGHRGPPRRRRVRHPAVRLPAREGAPDRRRRGAGGQRPPLRLEGQDLQHRRQRRPGRGDGREHVDRGPAACGRFRLLRRQEPGRPRARVLGARRSGRAPARRNPVAAAAAVGAQGKPLRAARAADHARGAADAGGRAGPRGAAAPEGRQGRADRASGFHARSRALPPDAARRPLGGADVADGARARRRAARAGPQPVHQPVRPDAGRQRASSSSWSTASTAPASRRTASASR